jgi:hypothetical protein
MFTVNWVVRGKEAEPIESEGFRVNHVSTLIMACRYRMAMMRLKYSKTPPDGFIVIDSAGKEIGRWFDSAAMP